MKDFRDKLAVVTGGGSGIGLAIAHALAHAGARIALVDLRPERLEQAAAALPSSTTQHTLDVSQPDQVRAFRESLDREHGPADLLINAAGVSVAGAFLDTAAEDFEWLMSINLGGTVHCCREFLPGMLTRPEAHIVNVSSSFGLVGFPGKTAYAASKFAVRGFSESLRMELRATKVGVTVLYPGPVDTNILADGRAASESQRNKEMRFLRGRAIPPERVAAATLSGIRRNAPRVLLSADYRTIDWLTRLSPTLAQYLVGVVGARELDG